MTHLLLAPLACLSLVSAAPADGEDTLLRIDPRLLAQAAEAWAVAGEGQDPIWPGWEVRETPLLFYYPGEQEVLLNHPSPPAGFVPYRGPLAWPGGEIAVRDGETVFAIDGQNTSTDVNGVETLVVADTLSNLRNNLLAWSQTPGSRAEREAALNLEMLAANPYQQMGLILHEAFHVEQNRWGLDKGADELAILQYPCLSVANNVGVALEADLLEEALTTEDEEALWTAALRWLAIRTHRRAGIPPAARAYEDGIEFIEGLATYVEWRLTYAVEGREPAPAMAWVRGFGGYADMSAERARLLATMRGFLTGERIVNNDPYGAAAVRFRLYWSGMAIGGLLDRIYPEWKQRIVEPGTTLTSLVEEALMPTAEDLEMAREEVFATAGHDALVAEKEQLREDGLRVAQELCAAILDGEGTLVVVDYSGLPGVAVHFAFTPFGITRVDEGRTIYRQVPIGARFGAAGSVQQTVAAPLLHDEAGRRVSFRLEEGFSLEDLLAALGRERLGDAPLTDLSCELPGVRFEASRAALHWSEGELVVELVGE